MYGMLYILYIQPYINIYFMYVIYYLKFIVKINYYLKMFPYIPHEIIGESLGIQN